MPTGQELIKNAIFVLIPLLLSLSVHEWAHAWTAHRLGDDTAALQGRLTLNPFAHMDPLGTLLLPLLGVPFGWAKPVPVNPARFRRSIDMGTGMVLTALAGPLSNLLLAVVCVLVFGGLARFHPAGLESPGLSSLLLHGIAVNVSLFVFNMLPIPPLDGSRVVDKFLPARLRGPWESLARFSPLLLLAVVMSGGSFLRGPIQAVMGAMQRLLGLVGGIG